MLTLKRAIAAGSVVAVLTLTAACGSSEPQGPFITPTPTTNNSQPGNTPVENPEDSIPEEIPTEKVDPDSVDLMPFQYDWTEYEVSQEAKDRWGEELATSALPRSLEALETAYTLTNAWEESERTVQDFEALREYLTPEMWEIFNVIIPDAEADPTNLMSFVMYRVPNLKVVTSDGEKFTPTGVPSVQMIENPRMSISQDEETFGDLEHRYTLGATFVHSFFGKNDEGEDVTASYERDVAIYLVPVGNEWYIDGWYATDMIPVG